MFGFDLQSFSPWLNGAIFAAAAVIVWFAGTHISRYADTLAERLHLGRAFVGLFFLAIATSTPEIATTITAVRIGNYPMAISNIFGSNSIMIILIFISDVFYRGGPILNVVGTPALFTIAMGIAVTAIYLAGMVERRNHTILRMGIDSALVLVFYVLSVALLYTMRGQA